MGGRGVEEGRGWGDGRGGRRRRDGGDGGGRRWEMGERFPRFAAGDRIREGMGEEGSAVARGLSVVEVDEVWY
jgi:hypothetical protein